MWYNLTDVLQYDVSENFTKIQNEWASPVIGLIESQF